jgi:hypothetical protein
MDYLVMPRAGGVLSFEISFSLEIQTGAQPLLGFAPSNTQNSQAGRTKP